MEERKFDTLALLAYASVEETEDSSKARKAYELACKQENTKELQLIADTECCEFYIRRHMYLKAESLAETICKENPESYAGYHCLFSSYLDKGQKEDAVRILDNCREQFKSTSQYMKDRIAFYESIHSYTQLMDELKNNSYYMEKIPEWTLWKRAKYYGICKNADALKDVLVQLYRDYHVKDAGVSLVMILMITGEKEKAYKIATELTDLCDSQNEKMIYQILEAVGAKMNGDEDTVKKDKAEIQGRIDSGNMRNIMLEEVLEAL